MAIAAIVGPNAFAQSETGTVIIIGYSQKKVVIAADSRRISQNGLYHDDGCKIAALEDKIVFAAFGRATSVASDGTFEWDATREARAVLATTQHLQTDRGGGFLDRVAENWGRLIGPEISRYTGESEVSDVADGQFLTSGIFAGIDESGALHISLEGISIRKRLGTASQIIVNPPRSVILTKAIQFRPFSEGDIFDEFMSAKNKRAKQWVRQLTKEAKRTRDADALKAIRLVDLTVRYGAETARAGNARVRLVGGKTDAAELVPGGSVQWIQRKPGCPDR